VNKKMQTREMPTISLGALREAFATAIPSAMVNPVAKRHWIIGLFRVEDRAPLLVTHPSQQWPTEPVRNVAGGRRRFGTVTGQDSVTVDVLVGWGI
jgi:hypothetical protein